MPPLVLWLLDGRVFVICTGLCLAYFLWLTAGKKVLWLRRVGWWVCIVAGINLLTSTPISALLLWAPLVLAALAMIILWPKSVSFRARVICGSVGFACSLAGLITELQWWPRPNINVADAGVVVIGDSLSAGIGTADKIWPVVLAENSGLKVVSVAFPGARIADGVKQLGRASVEGRVVVILLGGNDMLGRGSARAFHADLESLVLAVRAGGGRPFLIEFPVLPIREGFGRAMRDVAVRQAVPLLHRRYLAAVLQAPGATVDGLHLSGSGHRDMARTVELSLKPDTFR